MAKAQPLKKRNYNKKTISELRLQGKFTTCNENEIPDQIEDHSKNLYFSHEEYEEFIHDNLEIPRLSNEDRDSLEERSRNSHV